MADLCGDTCVCEVPAMPPRYILYLPMYYNLTEGKEWNIEPYYWLRVEKIDGRWKAAERKKLTRASLLFMGTKCVILRGAWEP